MIDRVAVLGVPLSVVKLDSATAAIVAMAKSGTAGFVTCPDVSNVVRAQKDEALMRAHLSAAMVSRDGTPLVWVGRLRGYPIGRACGPDLLTNVASLSAHEGIRHYLYGGKVGVSSKLNAALTQRSPGIQIVGEETPPFRELTALELDEVAARVNATRAQILWVGLSTPKQEALMMKLKGKVTATMIGVGAAFDFISGELPRAPKWMQRSGLEWLYRLLREPRRLWRRYLLMAPQFVFLVAKEALIGRRSG